MWFLRVCHQVPHELYLLLVWFTEHCLKHKYSGKCILLLDDHKSHCQIIVALRNIANTPRNPLAVKTNTILEYLIFGKVRKVSSIKKEVKTAVSFILHYVDSVESGTKKEKPVW